MALAFVHTSSIALMDGSADFYARSISNRSVDATTTMYMTLLNEPNAVCLDGSPGAFYFRPGSGSGANKWYIHHQGGGWCESLDDCRGRSFSNLGSSKKYGKTMT